MKRIIICCDGTWDMPQDTPHNFPTNVAKIARLISPKGLAPKQTPCDQEVYYHDGLGTGNLINKIAGGLFGTGLSVYLQQCYRFLINNYTPGDQLFLFGFSRGAYIARSLAGLLNDCGLLRKEHADQSEQAYQLYRNRAHTSSTTRHAFQKQFCWPHIEIHFIGVWDTVGSFGIPDFILPKLFQHERNFLDIELHPIIRNAFQALAIDERRRDFKPCLWRLPKETKPDHFEQVWFAGVHSDVGGGYAETGLSDIALHWMLTKAEKCGLTIKSSNLSLHPDPNGLMHNSKTGLFALLPDFIRPIDPPLLHHSVQQRKEYHPPNWPKNPIFVS